MKHPTMQEEKKLWRNGYKYVVGLDEVGRGALAGPVVACAVKLNSKFKSRSLAKPNKARDEGEALSELQNSKSQFKVQNLRDSKKLIPKAREKFYKILSGHPAVEWGIGRVYPRLIDRINILQATKLAMKRAVENLKAKSAKRKINFLILDGKMSLDLDIPQKAIVKADEKVFSCALASIIAKVKRDKTMLRYHKKYPRYGFDRHKGYWTDYHRAAVKKFGLCIIHRKSFRPICG